MLPPKLTFGITPVRREERLSSQIMVKYLFIVSYSISVTLQSCLYGRIGVSFRPTLGYLSLCTILFADHSGLRAGSRKWNRDSLEGVSLTAVVRLNCKGG